MQIQILEFHITHTHTQKGLFISNPTMRLYASPAPFYIERYRVKGWSRTIIFALNLRARCIVRGDYIYRRACRARVLHTKCGCATHKSWCEDRETQHIVWKGNAVKRVETKLEKLRTHTQSEEDIYILGDSRWWYTQRERDKRQRAYIYSI